jgi:hypothetical protein
MQEELTEQTYKPLYERPDDPAIDVPQEEVEKIKAERAEEGSDEFVIDESNFDSYFFDVRTHQPKDGQVLARFRGRAEFVDGQLKRDLIHILQYAPAGGNSAQKVMRKMAGASERDSIKVPLQIAYDLAQGMTVEQVCEKPYEFDCEFFYYTQPEYVPPTKNWDIIRLIGNGKPTEWTITSDIEEKIGEGQLNTENECSPEEDYGLPRRDRDVGEEVGCRPGEVGEGNSLAATEGSEGEQLLRPSEE